MPFIANLLSTVGCLGTCTTTVKCNDNVISYSFVDLDIYYFVDASTDGTVVRNGWMYLSSSMSLDYYTFNLAIC
jgi:hypothetical protein